MDLIQPASLVDTVTHGEDPKRNEATAKEEQDLSHRQVPAKSLAKMNLPASDVHHFLTQDDGEEVPVIDHRPYRHALSPIASDSDIPRGKYRLLRGKSKELGTSSSLFSSATTSTTGFAVYPEPGPHARCLELRLDGSSEAHGSERIAQLVAAMEDKEDELAQLLVKVNILVAFAKALWGEEREESHSFHSELDTVLRKLSRDFDNIRNLRLPGSLGLVSLGGHRSLLHVFEQCLKQTHQCLLHYVNADDVGEEDTMAVLSEPSSPQPYPWTHDGLEEQDPSPASTSRTSSKHNSGHNSQTHSRAHSNSNTHAPGTSTSTNALASPKEGIAGFSLPRMLRFASRTNDLEHRFSRFKESMTPTLSLLNQLQQAMMLVALLPAKADYPFEKVETLEKECPESIQWRSSLQPYYLGYEYSDEMRSYLRQLNIFFAATGRAYFCSNFITRQTVFSSAMVKYALAPKEAARMAVEYKKKISLGLLRAVWDVLEDPMMRWFAVSLGYCPNHKVTTERTLELPGNEEINEIKARFIWHPSTPSTSYLSALYSIIPSFPSMPSPSRDTFSMLLPTQSFSSLFSWSRHSKEPEVVDDEAVELKYPGSESSEPSPQPSSVPHSTGFFSFFSSSSRSNNSTVHTARIDVSERETAGSDEVKYEFHSVNTDISDDDPTQASSNAAAAADTTTPKAEHNARGPCLIFHVHGGGFVSQSSASHTAYLREWASVTGLPVLSIDYSLSPEAPYPIAHEECYAAYKWVLRHYHELGIADDSSAPLQVIVVGDSAGGNLVAGIALRAIQDGIPPPAGVVLIYPALVVGLSACVSRLVFNHDPVINYPSIALCLDSYLPTETLKQAADTDPYLSPGMASASLLSEFPPTHIFVGGIDPILDDGVFFAHRLHSLGRPVVLRVYDQLPHGFLNVTQSIPSSKHVVVDVASSITQLMFA